MNKNDILYSKLAGEDRDDLVNKIISKLEDDQTEGEFILTNPGTETKKNFPNAKKIKWKIYIDMCEEERKEDENNGENKIINYEMVGKNIKEIIIDELRSINSRNFVGMSKSGVIKDENRLLSSYIKCASWSLDIVVNTKSYKDIVKIVTTKVAKLLPTIENVVLSDIENNPEIKKLKEECDIYFPGAFEEGFLNGLYVYMFKGGENSEEEKEG